MKASKESLEQRSNPRFLARIAIFHGPYQRQILTDYSVNISTGGMFIESSLILPEGTEVTVKFKLANSDTVIVANARVAWVNEALSPKKPSLPPGMGLQFVNISLDDLHTIRLFLEKGKFEATW